MALEPGTRVLVVEDDDSMRQAIERLLNATGFTTAVYASAEELLAVGPVGGDACVVSDLKLPVMSGLELLAQLRTRSWSGSLILITAHDSPSVRIEAEQSGVAAYLAKPFLGSALVEAVRAAMGSTKPV
jgi:FixJ family two-component response regulator